MRGGPSAKASPFEFGPTMRPLTDVRSHVTVLTGLAQENGFAQRRRRG